MGSPMTKRGTESPAMSAMPTGAPISTPSCHRIFFFLLHGFFPQNVQPDGLQPNRVVNSRNRLQKGEQSNWAYKWISNTIEQHNCTIFTASFLQLYSNSIHSLQTWLNGSTVQEGAVCHFEGMKIFYSLGQWIEMLGQWVPSYVEEKHWGGYTIKFKQQECILF